MLTAIGNNKLLNISSWFSYIISFNVFSVNVLLMNFLACFVYVTMAQLGFRVNKSIYLYIILSIYVYYARILTFFLAKNLKD